jgi:hypothetical protein
VITAVYGEQYVGNSWGSLAICVADGVVVLRVNPDTDEIIATYEAHIQLATDWKPITCFDSWIGMRLSWCWVSRNSRGYLDMFTISLSDIDPAFAFVAAGSSLRCRRLVDFPEPE